MRKIHVFYQSNIVYNKNAQFSEKHINIVWLHNYYIMIKLELIIINWKIILKLNINIQRTKKMNQIEKS